jgi:solute carrier family 15 (oligopeptide transporter), member 1
MSGDLGFIELKPDQMQVVNPLLILVFIPLYEVVFYPLLRYVGVRRPLQKLTIGGILAGVSFVVSAFVEINLSKTYAVMPDNGEAQFRIFNGRNCNYTFESNITDHTSFSINAMQHFEQQYIKIDDGSQYFNFEIKSATPAETCGDDIGFSHTVWLENRGILSTFLKGTGQNGVDLLKFYDSPEKSRRGWPFITVLSNIASNDAVTLVDSKDTNRYNGSRTTTLQEDVPAGNYEVFVGSRSVRKDLELKLGGVYTLIIGEDFSSSLKMITEPNSMNMLWLIPQYVIMTLGEVDFGIQKSDAIRFLIFSSFRSCSP